MSANNDDRVVYPETDNNINNPWAVGTAWAAGALLLVASAFAFFQGIAALAGDDTFVLDEVVGDTNYIYDLSMTGWGWIHIVIGIIGACIAIGIFLGATWARVCAIIIASFSIIANFLWLPYNPWWAILVIILDIIVIWAMANWVGDND